MITITNKSKELTKVEEYLMTLDPGIISIKDIDDGTIIEVDAFIEFEDTKDDGDTSSIMSVITPDKKVYACQSATFKRSLKDIAGIMDGEPFSIEKISGVTKNDRKFVNCKLHI